MNNSPNKKNLIIVAFLLLLLLSGFLLFTKKTKRPVPAISDAAPALEVKKEEKTEETTEGIFNSTLTGLINMGKALKCTFTSTAEGSEISGTSYVSGKKVNYVSKIRVDGQPDMESYMIVDGDWAYTWTNQNTQGFKIKYSDLPKEQTTDSATDKTKVNVPSTEAKIDYDCTPWIADENRFVVPNNITFTDYSQMFKDVTKTSGDSEQNAACSVCNYAQSDDDKATCRKQFNCQ